MHSVPFVYVLRCYAPPRLPAFTSFTLRCVTCVRYLISFTHTHTHTTHHTVASFAVTFTTCMPLPFTLDSPAFTHAFCVLRTHTYAICQHHLDFTRSRLRFSFLRCGSVIFSAVYTPARFGFHSVPHSSFSRWLPRSWRLQFCAHARLRSVRLVTGYTYVHRVLLHVLAPPHTHAPHTFAAHLLLPAPCRLTTLPLPTHLHLRFCCRTTSARYGCAAHLPHTFYVCRYARTRYVFPTRSTTTSSCYLYTHGICLL